MMGKPSRVWLTYSQLKNSLYLRSIKGEINMKVRYVDFIIFIFSAASLLISVKLFWNMGVYIDAYGVSADIISGGQFWASMDLLRVLMLGALFIFSLLRLFKQQDE